MNGWKVASVVMLCAVLSTGMSSADISVIINTDSGALMIHDGGSTYPDNALPGGSMIQMIWSTVNAYSPSFTPYLQDGIVQPGVDANYWILWTGYTPNSANPGTIESADDIDGEVDYANTDVGGNNIHAGYLYVRIYDSASPVVGSWYASSIIYDTSTFAVRPAQPANPPADPVDAANGPGAINVEGTLFNQLNHGQVVPEPSTIMLALAGMGLLVYRRLRK